ncbi:unnamed protein product [Microthlaspi erraticum]|uniref:Reverse transcriptase zinc-binding domain-containing protein n=1 Tax=Microthlaspi erraticum TaxID=1685480 RepID=A0A6D2HDQ0_9BRAS|nr:unnamed protein product [Microthlaspi erraticum]
MRPKVDPKRWASSVWFEGSVPKHAFNMWITHLDRLPTRSRLACWGIPTSVDCCFCGRETETMDHLFVRCRFSTQNLVLRSSENCSNTGSFPVLARDPLSDK